MKNSFLGYTLVITGLLIGSAGMIMSSKSVKTAKDVDNVPIVINPPGAQIEEYIKEENTDAKYGDDSPQTEHRQVSDNSTSPTTPTSPSPAPLPSAPVDVTDTKSYCWQVLKSMGFSDAAAAGVMGSVEHESHFDPNAKNSKGYYGLFQLDPSGRAMNLKQNFPNNYTTVEGQMSFFQMEWAAFSYGSYCSDAYYNKYNYKRVSDYCANAGLNITIPFTMTSKEAFQSGTNVNDCTFLFSMGFERTGSKDKSYIDRITYAQTYYNTFGGH